MSAELLREAADRLDADPAFNRVPGSPDVGKALAAWLRLAAADDETGFYSADLEAIAVANAILGRDTA